MNATLDAERIARLLAVWPVGRLAMVSAVDGGPWVTPVVFAPAGGSIWTPVDGKPKSGGPLARLVNAGADPRVSLLLDEYAEDWSRLWWVRIDATVKVHRVESESGPAAEAIAALRAKYPQYREVPLFSGPPTLLELTVVRSRAWEAAGRGNPASTAECGSAGRRSHSR